MQETRVSSHQTARQINLRRAGRPTKCLSSCCGCQLVTITVQSADDPPSALQRDGTTLVGCPGAPARLFPMYDKSLIHLFHYFCVDVNRTYQCIALVLIIF